MKKKNQYSQTHEWKTFPAYNSGAHNKYDSWNYYTCNLKKTEIKKKTLNELKKKNKMYVHSLMISNISSHPSGFIQCEAKSEYTEY